ncbi:transcription factor Adf-1-like [Periplaneta americana]|uniref:transcription factor Adf-1-like n=1 Tax=Periplaneta americana TaxID=6978 RepID=UPI0037E81DC7
MLYDMSNEDYRNVRKKDQLWHGIGKELLIPGDQLKKRWKNLRDTYSKFLKTLKATTGQSAKKNYSNWQWAKQMEFFKPFLAFARTDTNLEPMHVDLHLDEAENDLNCSEVSAEPISGIKDEDRGNANFALESSESPITEQTATPQAQKSKKRKFSEETSVDKVVQYLENNRRHTDMDATELLFMSYAKTLKTFSSRRQAITKIKIAHIFMEQEIEQAEEEALLESHSTVSAQASTAIRFQSPANTSSGSQSPLII